MCLCVLKAFYFSCMFLIKALCKFFEQFLQSSNTPSLLHILYLVCTEILCFKQNMKYMYIFLISSKTNIFWMLSQAQYV